MQTHSDAERSKRKPLLWSGILNQGLAQKICNSQKCSSLKENNNISANWLTFSSPINMNLIQIYTPMADK